MAIDIEWRSILEDANSYPRSVERQPHAIAVRPHHRCGEFSIRLWGTLSFN
jgi:hypothetical protein